LSIHIANVFLTDTN